MKLKKLFAGIVAVAMMATMGATSVFATEKVPTDKISVENGKFTITKTYTIANGVAPTETFVLEQTAKVSTAKSSISTEAFKAGDKYNLTIGDATYTSGSNNPIGFEVSLPDYDNHPGIYTYTLKEKNNGIKGVTYDPNEYTLTVYATQAADEDNLTSENSLNYSVRLDVNGATKGSDNYKVTGLTNSYTSHSIKVTKKVKGNMADRAETFKFKATFSGLDNMKGSIMVNGEAITLDRENAATFTLKHGESYEFTNIPEGVTADVKELNAADEAVSEGDSNGTYTVRYTTKTEKNSNVDVTVTNTSTENVDTGVILDNAPYIALLTIVAAGAVVMIIKKRRNYED